MSGITVFIGLFTGSGPFCHFSLAVSWSTMNGADLAADCSNATELSTFERSMTRQLWKHDALLLTEAVLAGIIVAIGAYGQRYRHQPSTRFIFLGATTLFLPIISSLVSTVGTDANYVVPLRTEDGDDLNQSLLVAKCTGTNNSIFLVVWAFLVQLILINTSTLVSVDDREGKSKGPPLELLVQGLWTLYLGTTILTKEFFVSGNFLIEVIGLVEVFVPFALLISKLALKYYAFKKARRSFALGRNPALISAYMQQLQAQEANQNGEPPVSEDAPPPPLLVMREEEIQMEMQPGGYAFKDDSAGTTLINNVDLLVTVDKVWDLDRVLQISTLQLKDLCLSFALFKLLRCRFARYKLTNASSMGTLTFFRSLLLKMGDHDRVFGLIADELSFVHDYYYSSLPIFYSKCCLPILSIILSLLCIAFYVMFTIIILSVVFIVIPRAKETLGQELSSQLYCQIWCIKKVNYNLVSHQLNLGRLNIDLVPLFLLLVIAVTAEVKDMASYLCSNWTKVTLICCYANCASSQCCLGLQKWVLSLLLRCRCKLMKHWDGKMSQCSVLVLPPRTSGGLLVLIRRLLRLPDHRRKIKVPAAVNVCIVNALRSVISNGSLRDGVRSLRRSQVGESFIWACDGKGTSHTILLWHIATCILEVKHQYRHDQKQGSPPLSNNSDHKIIATHLSRYCAYLVTWYPELLPDNVAWSKSLYEAVKKDAKHALAGHSAARLSTIEYQQLIETLSQNSKHELLKNGVKLGKQLVETIEEEEMAWKLLADFWSEMILYVAPSDNLEGHKEAIARGGELITLLWAMLFHAGIVSRPGEEDGVAAATTSAGAV
ncbi:hypothetical protein HU200_028007 [Digitaria exilis]|uniref:DUF4220 domain-containing protein n=1 Tax=Digitaria exilis TaxID=1010633 RepID=A0A835ET30_9POAL|nr:hypothetical protein HU200_028007 [Digitaria exilis]